MKIKLRKFKKNAFRTCEFSKIDYIVAMKNLFSFSEIYKTIDKVIMALSFNIYRSPNNNGGLYV